MERPDEIAFFVFTDDWEPPSMQLLLLADVDLLNCHV